MSIHPGRLARTALLFLSAFMVGAHRVDLAQYFVLVAILVHLVTVDRT